MIQISQCKMPVGHSAQDLENKIRKLLRLKVSEPFTYEIRKKSIDARKKTEVYLVYQLFVSLDKEQERVAKLHQPSIAMAKEVFYHLPEEGAEPLELPPVVIGMGPAGLFAAYLLAERGYQPIVIERGQEISKRKKKVELFWETGTLCANSKDRKSVV